MHNIDSVRFLNQILRLIAVNRPITVGLCENCTHLTSLSSIYLNSLTAVLTRNTLSGFSQVRNFLCRSLLHSQIRSI